jgi:hypothetical protein
MEYRCLLMAERQAVRLLRAQGNAILALWRIGHHRQLPERTRRGTLGLDTESTAAFHPMRSLVGPAGKVS